MNVLHIPEKDQINAMLDGSVYELVSNFVESPSRWDLRKYLTVNRQGLVNFLVENPSKTANYYQKQKATRATHDVERIWQDGEEYVVASMDHGKQRFVRRFKSLAEAVAEHVLVNYGMY